MATVVIVPAAFSGGWTWKDARVGLQAAGHEVYALTLTGLGERRHLAGPAIDLDTHVQDVVQALEYEDLRDVVLVGHSYGGMVLAAVADRAADRLARLIYVDAVLPRDGECMLDLFPPEGRAQWEERARSEGEGWQVPPWDPPDWRYAPQPLKTIQQPVRITGTDGSGARAVYVRCTTKTGPDFFARSAARARERGWPVVELATDHNPPATAPRALVEALLKVI